MRDQYSMNKESILDEYIDYVIKPVFPNATLQDFIDLGGRIDFLQLFNHIELFKQTPFEISFPEGKDYIEFIHFTGFDTAIEILKSKTIRMSNLFDLKDKSEFNFTCEYLASETGTNHCFNVAKSTFFSLSLCEFSESTLFNSYMWKEYARNGSGYALKLRVFKSDKDWSIPPSFQLGKINYQDFESIKILDGLKQRHEQFISENNSIISDLSSTLAVLSCFYKQQKYFRENEVRLLYHSGLVDHDRIRISDVGKCFIELNLETIDLKTSSDLIILIDKIYYLDSSSYKGEIKKVFRNSFGDKPEMICIKGGSLNKTDKK